MDSHAASLWKHAPAIEKQLAALTDSSSETKERVKNDLFELLGLRKIDGTSTNEEAKPGVEDYEYALTSALIQHLDSSEEQQVLQAINMLDVTASVVAEVFQRAARQGAPQNETEKCKAWWTMLFIAAEDAAKLVPVKHMDQFVDSLEVSLSSLRSAYLQFASQRLSEFDAKQATTEEKEKEAEKEKDPKDQKGKDDAKDAKAKEEKRTEERKKMITHLGISPNGQLYLTMTSLLKQLSSRLCGSLQAALRARIVLLLERLLAMDHKAIANNQKLKTADYVQVDDLEKKPTETASTDDKQKGEEAKSASEATGAAAESGVAAAKDKVASESKPSLAKDVAAKGHDFYVAFWALQEYLQYPDRVMDKESWQSFKKTLHELIALFQKYPSQARRRQPWAPPETMPLRHAPRAQELPVQLEDAAFRQQFLTQVLLAFHTLQQDTGSTRRGADTGGIIGRQPDSFKKEFEELKRKCESALEATRPGFLPLFSHALEREAHWAGWKANGCREFEHSSLEMLNAKMPPSDKINGEAEALGSRRPQLAPHIGSVLKTLKDPQWKLPATMKPGEADATAMRQHETKTRCDAYLDRLIEDDKPENGIEEEYKAKKNKVFMWQARRLFCQQYLSIYAHKDVLAKVEFMDVVKMIKGAPMDAPAPSPSDEPQKSEGEQAATATADDGAAPSDGAEEAPAAAEETATADAAPAAATASGAAPESSPAASADAKAGAAETEAMDTTEEAAPAAEKAEKAKAPEESVPSAGEEPPAKKQKV
eukprot:TRINITY_DN31652_c0_g1_i1.p1 TRINITY_DN31652_c0_g1~~TRINITY_DN31652_c0_g1_i1.p1  ORF type:complete len:786 (-),score=202.32 TRINITY_DN31652_c0_g1_i1:90-2390(-)